MVNDVGYGEIVNWNKLKIVDGNLMCANVVVLRPFEFKVVTDKHSGLQGISRRGNLPRTRAQLCSTGR